MGALQSVVVAEVFGPTLQGEGPNIGRHAAFVRLGGCNLHCSWCDTPYTWDASRFDLRQELQRMDVDDIARRVEKMNPGVVVLTGGEPLLWQSQTEAWRPLTEQLWAIAPVEIETNGTIEPDPTYPIARYNVSPKLEHAGDPEHARIKLPALRAFAALAEDDRAALKVVCRTPEDVRAAAGLSRVLRWPRRSVFVMPEGTTADELLARHGPIADAAIQEGINMTTRLHVLSWGPERGR